MIAFSSEDKDKEEEERDTTHTFNVYLFICVKYNKMTDFFFLFLCKKGGSLFGRCFWRLENASFTLKQERIYKGASHSHLLYRYYNIEIIDKTSTAQ